MSSTENRKGMDIVERFPDVRVRIRLAQCFHSWSKPRWYSPSILESVSAISDSLICVCVSGDITKPRISFIPKPRSSDEFLIFSSVRGG